MVLVYEFRRNALCTYAKCAHFSKDFEKQQLHSSAASRPMGDAEPPEAHGADPGGDVAPERERDRGS